MDKSNILVAAFVIGVFGFIILNSGGGGGADVNGTVINPLMVYINGKILTNGTQGPQGIQGIQGIQGVAGVNGTNGTDGNNSTLKAYTLHVQALTSSPGDSVTRYFGNLPKAPVSAANTSKVYIPRNGTIVAAVIYCYSGTAGTNENLSLYIRKGGVDTLIKTVGVAASERVFDNYALNIPVVQGQFIEIKCVHPLWATNPLTTIFGGVIYIE